MKSIKKIAIIGVGFMGGSLALALKKSYPYISIWGFARSKRSLYRIKKLNVFNRIEQNLKDLVKDADLIVLALPIYAIIEMLKKISPFLKKDAIVCDLGSTKELVEKSAHKILPKGVKFVGCHPLCGGEKHGAEFSKADLYKGALCLVTSSPKRSASKTVDKIWKKLGMKTIYISPSFHDKVLSPFSHLPHFISFSLTRSTPLKYAGYSGASFKDLTRISNSPPSVWTDIFLSNKKNILKDIAQFMKMMQDFKELIRRNNRQGILRFITQVNKAQESLEKRLAIKPRTK
ncbi:MAG: prephenate dehydrogenase [Candidatus Omnitrophota bacterium]|nr:MAG: prephenate dehydrogenase [Candidatus Omnitrophota bacterium]